MKTAIGLLAVACLLTQLAHAAAPSPVPKQKDTLAKIRASGVIIVGHRTASIPFSYHPSPGARPIGYSISICERIIESLKLEYRLPRLRIQYQPVTTGNRLSLLANGGIDIECGSTTETEVRNQQVDFSLTTFVAATRVAIPKGGAIRSLHDLNGKRVGVTNGTTNQQVLEQFAREHKMVVKTLLHLDHDATFSSLQKGRADAVVMDDVLLIGLMAQAGDQDRFEFLKESLSGEPYAIVLRKNEPQFKAFVDRTINDLIDTGALAKLYQQWFRSPIPPKRFNLNLPFTEEMAKTLKLIPRR